MQLTELKNDRISTDEEFEEMLERCFEILRNPDKRTKAALAELVSQQKLNRQGELNG